MRQELQTVVDSLESNGLETSVEEVKTHNEHAQTIHTLVNGIKFEFYYETGNREFFDENKEELWEVESRSNELITDVWQSFTAPEGVVQMTEMALKKSDKV